MIDVDRIKISPAYLSKLSSAVDNNVVKNTKFENLLQK